MDMASPNNYISSSDPSGSEDNFPLASLITVHAEQVKPAILAEPAEQAEIGEEANTYSPLRDWSDVLDAEEDLANVGKLLSKAINTIDNTTKVTHHFLKFYPAIAV